MAATTDGMRKNFALTPSQKQDAREALRLLGDRNLTLEHCVRHTLGLKADGVDLSLQEAVEKFLAYKEGRIRSTTWRSYEHHASWMLRTLDRNESIAATTRSQWASYIQQSMGRFLFVRTLISFASEIEGCGCSPQILRGVKPKISRDREVQFLSVEQAEEIMAGIMELGPAMALCLFAGIRTGELGGLDNKPKLLWRHVDTEARTIRIPASNAKTGRTRVIESAPDNLWSWLEPAAAVHDPSTPILPVLPTSMIRRVRALCAGGYPSNAARHSFATYHVAAYQNPGLTSLILGHEGNTSLLYRHYRGLATQAEGLRFFGILP